MKRIKGLKHFFYNDRLRELELFNLEIRRFMEALNTTYEYLREEDSKDYGVTLFSVEFKGETRSNGHNEGFQIFTIFSVKNISLVPNVNLQTAICDS